MKKFILPALALLSLVALAPVAEARPHFYRPAPHCPPSYANYDRFGRPIYANNIFVGRDHFGRPIYRRIIRDTYAPRYCPPPRYNYPPRDYGYSHRDYGSYPRRSGTSISISSSW